MFRLFISLGTIILTLMEILMLKPKGIDIVITIFFCVIFILIGYVSAAEEFNRMVKKTMEKEEEYER